MSKSKKLNKKKVYTSGKKHVKRETKSHRKKNKPQKENRLIEPKINYYFDQFYHPEKVLLLGSGVTETPKEWFDFPNIRFNNKTFYSNNIPNNNVYCYIATKKYFSKLPKRIKSIINNNNGFFIEQYYKSIYSKFDLHNNYIFLGTGYNLRNLGDKMYKYWNVLNKDKKNEKDCKVKFARASTGFLSLIWILYSKSEEIYISGFDGYTNHEHFTDIINKDKVILSNNRHRFKKEFEIIIESCKLVSSLGKKIYIKTDNQVIKF